MQPGKIFILVFGFLLIFVIPLTKYICHQQEEVLFSIFRSILAFLLVNYPELFYNNSVFL